MSLAQDHLLQLATDISNLANELTGARSEAIALQQSIDDRNTVILDLQGQIGALNVELAAVRAALAADEAILHPPPPPPPPPPTAAGPMMGMVPGGWWWHPDGTADDGSHAVNQVADFERLMGRGVQVINQSLQNQTGAPLWTGTGPDPRTAAEKVAAAWVAYKNSAINLVIKHPGAIIGLPPRRCALRLQLGVTAQSAAANFAEIISGAQDAMFTAIFQAIKDRGFDRPFLGLGQESNGEWWPNTCSAGNEPAFKAALGHVAALAKAIIADCVTCYDVANTRAMGPAYPGDAVDAILLDYYDQGAAAGDTHGLAEMLAFGKPFLVTEWATRDALRGPAFIDFFWQAVTGSPLFLGQCYWDRNEAYLGALASNPLTKAEYLAKFGGQSPPIYAPPPPRPGAVSIKVNGWKSGSNPESNLDLLINGVVQSPANQLGAGTWVVGKMRSGDKFQVRVNSPPGKWWTVTGIIGTNDDGVGNWSIPSAGGALTINTGTVATFMVP